MRFIDPTMVATRYPAMIHGCQSPPLLSFRLRATLLNDAHGEDDGGGSGEAAPWVHPIPSTIFLVMGGCWPKDSQAVTITPSLSLNLSLSLIL